MNVFPKHFSSTKNIPQTESKHRKQYPPQNSHQQASSDKAFSEPYNPQDEFDFTDLLKCPQKYQFSLDPSSIFPRDHALPFGADDLPRQQRPFKFETREMPSFEFPDVRLDSWEEMVIEEGRNEDERDEPFF